MTILRAGANTRKGFATAYRTGTLLITNATWTAVAMQAEQDDTDDIWESVTNPSRFLTPTWATHAIFGCQVFFDNTDSTHQRICTGRKNGSEFTGKGYTRRASAHTTDESYQAWSAPTPVVGGTDYFECYAYEDSGSNLNVTATTTWGSLIVIGTN